VSYSGWMVDPSISPAGADRVAAQQRPGRIPVWACLLATVLLLGLLAAALLLMGRPLWCECGSIKLWHGEVMSSENSQHIADWYSFTHIIHGFGLYGIFWLALRRWSLKLRFLLTALVEVAWEVFENTDFVIGRYRDGTIALGYYGDSVINAGVDVLFCLLGFVLAARLPVWATIALAAALEAVLAYAIRDNFTLNIIMLIYPFEAIGEWQLGG
jgi:Protein of unknown function (DUF2585)